MAENSKIEWCDHTFNPWMGCTKVSPGCKHCYAETMMDKRWKKVQWGPQGVRVKTSTEMWRKPFTWNAKHVNGMPRQRVFCASLADVFEDNPQLVVWRSMLFWMIEMTSNLDWLLLTKRPENIMQMVPPRWADRFPKNIWLGTSVENQKAADERIGHLVRTPALVKFLSCEPLLEKVDLDLRGRNYGIGHEYVNWVICGGESGKQAHPMHPTWVKSIRDQCVRNDVPFFFKQWGEWMPVADLYADEGPDQALEWIEFWNAQVEPNGYIPVMTPPISQREGGWHEFQPCPGTWVMAKVGKKRAGRVLDGRTWDELPR